MAEFLLEKGLFSSKNELDLLFGDTNNQLTLTMNRLFLTLAVVFAGTIVSGPSIATAEQYANIEPGLKCRFYAKNKSFCWRFPNFSLKNNICNPAPDCLGHIVWCTEDVTITEQDSCGNWDTYEATVITYRKVYENGAWGEKFKRTVRKSPTLVTPPVLAKGSYK